MIDKIIVWLAERIVNVMLPSTLLKLCLTALIVSSILSLLVGYGLIIVTLVVVNAVYLTSEYLYARDIEADVEANHSEMPMDKN